MATGMPERKLGVPGDFDVIALCEAVEERRASLGLKWGPTVFQWMSRSTMERMRDRGTATCNHVLPMVQWLGRAPESFTVDADGAEHQLLPDPQGRWRWWWAHHDLASEVDAKRQDREMKWSDVAEEIGVAAAAVQGIGKLRYGPPIGLAMIAARWVHRPAASFMTEIPPSAFNR